MRLLPLLALLLFRPVQAAEIRVRYEDGECRKEMATTSPRADHGWLRIEILPLGDCGIAAVEPAVLRYRYTPGRCFIERRHQGPRGELWIALKNQKKLPESTCGVMLVQPLQERFNYSYGLCQKMRLYRTPQGHEWRVVEREPDARRWMRWKHRFETAAQRASYPLAHCGVEPDGSLSPEARYRRDVEMVHDPMRAGPDPDPSDSSPAR